MAQAHLSHSGTALPEPFLRPFGRIPAWRAVEATGYGLFGVFVFLIGFDLTEPSPYDLLVPLVILLWLALGVRLPRAAVVFVGLLLIYALGLVLGLIPHLNDTRSITWVAISAYLLVTAVFFTMFFSEDSELRLDFALRAFLGICVVSALAGILGYFDVAGTGGFFSKFGRASGTFEDPNVFGSFLILGLLYAVRRSLTGDRRPRLLTLAALPILLAGIFLSFSRGSWAATCLAMTALLVLTFAGSPDRQVRRRIILLSFGIGAAACAALFVLLANEDIRAMFELRAQAQDYDVGETGRFGNQLRAILALIDRPNGFGPQKFVSVYGLEPHNSYVNAFASAGWVGGLAFIGLMLATTYVGLRLSATRSPFQGHAQILFAMHLTFVLQSFQIDIDHWRHVYLVWGGIWGLEAASRRWLSRPAYSAPQGAPMHA
jgi:O-antigen ligase